MNCPAGHWIQDVLPASTLPSPVTPFGVVTSYQCGVHRVLVRGGRSAGPDPHAAAGAARCGAPGVAGNPRWRHRWHPRPVPVGYHPDGCGLSHGGRPGPGAGPRGQRSRSGASSTPDPAWPLTWPGPICSTTGLVDGSPLCWAPRWCSVRATTAPVLPGQAVTATTEYMYASGRVAHLGYRCRGPDPSQTFDIATNTMMTFAEKILRRDCRVRRVGCQVTRLHHLVTVRA